MAAAVQSAPVPAHELVHEPEQLPKLRSNHGDFLDKSGVGWMEETPIDTSLDEMRRRFDRDGYPGTSPRDGIFDEREDPITHNGVGGRDLPEDRMRVEKLIEAHVHPMYLSFLDHPELRAFVRVFMSWKKEVLVKRTMLRHNVPNGLSTGVHYDRLFIRAGEADFLTAWVPIGDCSAEGGGLMYLENSDDIGHDMEAQFIKRNMDLPPEERISGFNMNMARDGQLTHNVHDFTQEIRSGKAWWCNCKTTMAGRQL